MENKYLRCIKCNNLLSVRDIELNVHLTDEMECSKCNPDIEMFENNTKPKNRILRCQTCNKLLTFKEIIKHTDISENMFCDKCDIDSVRELIKEGKINVKINKISEKMKEWN